MPQLIRLRFVNLGHENARIEDLTLPFHDESGRPTDTIIWLRNGGGKSSLLSLFFSLVNPNRNQFLKANEGSRRLEHYILDGDCAVIIAEWQLDAPDEMPERYLTGYFCERERNDFKRLFFSSRVYEPLITLENIPLKNKNGERLNFHGFKTHWQNLCKPYPQAEPHEVESQKEWETILADGARIDSELFGYQMHMNSQEGGADKLFSFKTDEHFVDFFLEMTMPLDKSEAVADNVREFRVRLRERKNLLSELSLVETLKPKIVPMIEVAEHLQIHRKHTGELHLSLRQLQKELEQRSANLNKEAGEINRRADTAKVSVEKAITETNELTRRALSLERFSLEKRRDRLSSEFLELVKRLDETKHAHSIWKAALPLVEVIRLQESIRELEEELHHQDAILAPDWSEVHRAASNLAAALQFRSDENYRLSRLKVEAAEKHREKSKNARHKAGNLRQLAGRAEKESEDTARKIERAQIARTNLENGESLEPNESLQTALERWRRTVENIELDMNRSVGESEKLERQLDFLAEELERSRQQSFKAQQSLEESNRTFNEARAKRDKLLGESIFNQLSSEIDGEVVSRATLELLRRRSFGVETQRRELGVSVAENAFVYEYLQANSLFPPTRDVRTILKVLEDKNINAFPGWRHVAEVYQEPGEARFFIETHLETVLGIIVPDKNFKSAKAALSKANLRLDAAIAVVPQSFAFSLNGDSDAEAKKEKRFVVGPTSDAHFNEVAAKSEEITLEIRLRQERVEREILDEQESELRRVIGDLNGFLLAYPKDWFTTCEIETRTRETYYQECTEYISRLENERDETTRAVNQSRKKQEILLKDKQRSEEHLRKLKVYCEVYGTDKQLQEFQSQKTKAELHAKSLISEAKQEDKIAESESNQRREREDEAIRLEADAHSDLSEISSIEHLKSSVSPQPGDVDSLRNRHRKLSDRVKRKLSESHIRMKLEQERTALKQSKNFFDSVRDKNIDEAEIQRALKAMPDKDTIQRRRDETEKQKSELERQSGKLENITETARANFEHHQQKYRELITNISDKESKLGEAELESLASVLQEKAAAVQMQVIEGSKEIEHLEKECFRIQTLVETIDDWHRRISNLLQDDLFQDAIEVVSLAEKLPDESEIKIYLQELERSAQEARKRRARLLDERAKIHTVIRRVLEDAPFEFARKLKIWGEEYFESSAQQVFRDLETRERNIRDELVNHDVYRKTIVNTLLDIAERGTEMLRKLAAHSKLPKSAGNLAEQSFLKIDFKLPESQIERRERVETLIDRVIDEDKMPSGIELVQRVVRKLPQSSIRIRVLFPDVDAPSPRYIPITGMSNESSGESLTSAVLIYCALVRQRAQERGVSAKNSSTLLLDNPFGKSTRRKFVNLQREMARAMNIQLIYPTGVDSDEALSVFPKIIRLRNERRNSKGHGLIEMVSLTKND